MNKSGLEFCPFCGDTEVLLNSSSELVDVGMEGYRIECPTCATMGPLGDRVGAKSQWNCWVSESRAMHMKEIKTLTWERDTARNLDLDRCKQLAEALGVVKDLKSDFLIVLGLLDRNTTGGPPCDPDTGECYFCDYGIIADTDDWDNEKLLSPAYHKPDCPWKQARDMFDEKKVIGMLTKIP